MVSIEEVNNNLPKEREEKLREIERFSFFDVFFYRSNLWHHQLRVFLLVRELEPLITKLLPQCDTKKAQVLALVHDDAETITGDIQLGHKQNMTTKELHQVDKDEADAIEILAGKYPKEICGYNYRELLTHALHKDCIEAQVVSYVDKLDAYCESLHEVFAGNIPVIRSVMTYIVILNSFGEKFPELKPLVKSKESPLTDVFDSMATDSSKAIYENYSHLNKPHTAESVKQNTEIRAYNRWKELVLENLGNEGESILTTQKDGF